MNVRNTLKGLYLQISESADNRTDLGHFSDVTAGTIAAVRGIEAFELVYRKSLN